MTRSAFVAIIGRMASRRTLVLVTLAFGLLEGACSAAPQATSPPGRPVVLVGLDAADWAAIDPLVHAGKLPAFERLQRFGRTGTMLSTPPLLSPILWTTIATGRPPEDHGVLDFMVDRPSGGQAPVAVSSRRVPALWNLFSHAGRRVAVVGWWATWPAESVAGTIVSDRVAPQLLRSSGPLDPQAISPRTAAARLAPSVVQARAVSSDELARYVRVKPGELEEALHADAAGPGALYANRLAHLAAVIAGTRTYSAMAVALAGERPALLAVYLEGIDTVQHLFIRDRERGPQALEAAYRDADALLARLAAASPPEAWILVCSDHGFQPVDAGVAEDPSDLAGPAAAWHRPYGIVAAIEARQLAGTGTSAGDPRSAGIVTPLDIAPTVLHAAGLPLVQEMPGHIVEGLLPEEAVARPVTRQPAPPWTGVAVEGGGDGLDAEVQARLQALGYVGAQPTSLARQNLGEVLYRAGKLPAAERELRAAVESQPQNLAAHLWLAKALRDQGRTGEALQIYRRALALPEGTRDALVEAVETAVRANDLEAARALLAGRPPSEALHVAKAVVAQAEGRSAAAESALKAALALDPTSHDALARLLDLWIPARRAREAVPFATAAARRVPRSPRHQALLGEALLAAGDAKGAETAFACALSLAPDAAAVRLDLARAQMTAGRPREALSSLEAASASRERSILLGAAHAQLAEWPQSAARYRDALAQGEATPPLLNGLAWAELKQGRSAEAASLLGRSLALDRNQPEIGRLLAQIRGSGGAR
jgi:tetratricopeptide (TPR) repeat protein